MPLTIFDPLGILAVSTPCGFTETALHSGIQESPRLNRLTATRCRWHIPFSR
jgi:hypothetical protein